MAKASDNVIIADGQVDFSGGADSATVPSRASRFNPQGLALNSVAWLNNATVRDGGAIQRTGWQPIGPTPTVVPSGLYQGGWMVEDGTGLLNLNKNPYLLLLISGQLWGVHLDGTAPPINITAFFGGALSMPPTAPQAFFAQAEEFVIIQAGDFVTKPLFWDSFTNTLRRSIGITTSAPTPNPGQNEIPAAGPMEYYMGRLWYAQGRFYSAGDIVGGPSGTLPKNFRDSVLAVTEAPIVFAGDGFAVGSTAGNIRMLKGEPNLDAQMGQGRLLAGTRRIITALTVPVSRKDWIATDNSNQPLQVVAQRNNGPVNDRSCVEVNGDLFYQSLEPSVRSYQTARKDFSYRWGNTVISAAEERILQFVDRSLLDFSSGIYFDNRLLMTSLPMRTPSGIIHQAILPLDFEPISNFTREIPAAWEGHYEGLRVFQLFRADFGGLERAFAVVLAQDNSIQVWELTTENRFENGDNRVEWYVELGAFNWQREFDLKKLVGCDLWVDKLFGDVEFTMEWRPDSDPCWQLWHKWKACSARNSCEDVNNPICYPTSTDFRESFRATMTLPRPPNACEAISKRPMNIGLQHQFRITVKGWCRIRGAMFYAEVVERGLYPYAQMVC